MSALPSDARTLHRRSWQILPGLVVVGLIAAPLLAWWLDNSHILTVAQRIVIFGIAAVGLNLILGFGGLVSLGHAAFMGIGSYAVGILAFHGWGSGWLQLVVALAASAVGALIIGALSLRTRGVYFIMVTLAFAQMVYFVGVGLAPYGGDDGMTIDNRSNFGSWLNFDDNLVFYVVSLLCLAASALLVYAMTRSPFGLVLKGAAQNERRVVAMGYALYHYQLVAFVVSGVLCGLAGFLLANQNNFVSPATMHWVRSADLVIMIILGGLGSVLGPLVGAVVLMLAEDVLSSWTHYWQAVLGVLLFLAIRYAPGGLSGIMPGRGRHD